MHALKAKPKVRMAKRPKIKIQQYTFLSANLAAEFSVLI
jgi:hypothetical protein